MVTIKPDTLAHVAEQFTNSYLLYLLCKVKVKPSTCIAPCMVYKPF